MKQIIALLLCIALPSATFASDAGFRIAYAGGSIPAVKPGTGLKIHIGSERIQLIKDKSAVATIPSAAVTEVSYGQDVHRRVGAAVGLAVFSFGLGALMALSKSKKHFIGLTWDDAGVKGGIAFQADKNEYRGVLAALEGVSGKKAVKADTMTVKN